MWLNIVERWQCRRIDEWQMVRCGQPRNGTRAVVAVSVLVAAVCYATGYPASSGADPAIDMFFYFGVAGASCLMTVYLLVEIGTFGSFSGVAPASRGGRCSFPHSASWRSSRYSISISFSSRDCSQRRHWRQPGVFLAWP